MRRIPKCVVVLAVLLAGVLSACSAQIPGRKPTRVLFVGNSLVYSNNFPAMFLELGLSGGHRVDAAISAQPDWLLSDHLSGGTADTIAERDWHKVLLQTGSADLTGGSRAAAHELATIVAENGSETLLLLPPVPRDGAVAAGYADRAAWQQVVTDATLALAAELEAPVAPLGVAWQQALAQHPTLTLWDAGGSDPGREGAYLAACVLYATLFGESPVGLEYDAGLDEQVAARLQTVAVESVLRDPAQWQLPWDAVP